MPGEPRDKSLPDPRPAEAGSDFERTVETLRVRALTESLRTRDDAGKLPPLKFYMDFADDWDRRFTPAIKRELVVFLKALQTGPCQVSARNECRKYKDYFACVLPAGAVIYWKLEFDVPAFITLRDPDRIAILAVDLISPS